MINVNRVITSLYTESNDIFKDILKPLNHRDGFIKYKSITIPNYFYMHIGINDTSENYYNQLKDLHNHLYNLGNIYMNFTSEIPLEITENILIDTQKIWSTITSFNINQIDYLINEFKRSELLPVLQNKLFMCSLEDSFNYSIKLYMINNPNYNNTQIRNFCCKLIAWITKYIPNLIDNLDYDSCNTKPIYNPKILYYGDIKAHEVYFLILLSKMGFDVIYINPLNENNFIKVFNSNAKYIVYPKREEIQKYPFGNNNPLKDDSIINITSKENTVPYNIPLTDNVLSKVINSQEKISTCLKKSTNIIEDIKSSLESRIGFIGGDSPSIPVFFYRYIGISSNSDKYYNDLFNLDLYFSSFDDLYIKFLDYIPIGDASKISNLTKHIWNNISSLNENSKNYIVNELILCNAFPTLNNKVIKNTLINAFNDILQLFILNEKDININKIKNFSLKILMWCCEYLNTIFNKLNFNEKCKKIYNPKILYYGNIKVHEIYFLILLSKIGCDVIYINSSSHSLFTEIDTSMEYSFVIELETTAEITNFPTEERYVRIETSAFQASEEFSETFFTENIGIYKPWQLENYNIQPVTLKTTFDEIKILWNEPSSVRTGFQIQNGTVYIPNIFAKISGVYENIKSYCDDVNKLKSSENTIFISNIPFIKETCSQNNLYSLMPIFNRQGKIDKEKLISNSFYKYSYLKTSVQNLIIDKINILLSMDMFKNISNNEFILNLVMTLLNLNKDIIELIQRFDYPNKIPKLIIFHNNENVFSENEAVVIAFLNLMCFDIIILTPTGYNNIEQKIDEKFYDTHKLEEIKLNFDSSLLDGSSNKINSIFKGFINKIK